MTRMVLPLTITLAVLAGFTASARADVLLIEEVRTAEGMTLPVNGMSQADVRGAFGEPTRTYTPVGNPPITRWDYAGWSVYFEYDTVLSAVLARGHVVTKKPD
jgi:hypothetical protein